MRILLLLSALMHFLSPSFVQQTGGILFTNNTTMAGFPNTLTFSTTITAGSNITEVELIYGVKEETCSPVEANAFPEIIPAKQVTASWKWDMRESGSLPPGAEIWWQWKATTENGDTVTSDRQTVTWLDSVHPWKMIEDGNIRLHTYQIPDAQAAELLHAATDAEKRLSASTGMSAKNPIDLYIYPNSTEMKDAILYEPGWTGGMAFSEFNKIILGAVLDDMVWTKRTVAHELTHILVGNYSFSCLWTTPTWLEEGLAVLGEGEPDQNTIDQFNAAVKENKLLSFHILSASFSADPSKADLSYSQSYYMVKFLSDMYGGAKINLLLTTLAKGKTVDEALTDVYGFDLNKFEKDWRKLLQLPETVQPGITAGATSTPTVIPTLQPVTGGHSPAAAGTQILSTAAASTQSAVGNSATTTMGITPTILPVSSTPPAARGFGQAFRIAVLGGLAVLGLLAVLGIIIFLVIRAKNKKKGAITAFTILFLASAAMSSIAGKASGQSTQPTIYPQLPTATQYTPPQPAKNTYADPTAGISIEIPKNAAVDTSNSSATYFFQIVLGQSDVIGHLFSSPVGSDKTLKELGQSLKDGQSSGLENIAIIEDKEIQLRSGDAGWLTVFDANKPHLYQKLRVSLLTTRNYAQAVTLLLYGSVGAFDTYQAEIDQLNSTLVVTSPVLYGYSRDQVLMIEGGETDNPLENDPATTRSSLGDYLVFTGLVSFDPNLNLVPELAKSWDVSDDGLTYTFHLQPDARFHNNRPVTAEDVVYSWERAANPETNSETVLSYLGDIKGIKEMRAGKADHISGLKIIDDHTLQVSLESPVPYFLMKLTYPTGYVLDKDNVAMGKNWYRTPNGTGPYRLTRWEEKKAKLYELFDGFYGVKPKTRAIFVVMYQGTSTQLYEEGKIDFAGVSSNDLVRFTDPTEPLSTQLHSGVDLCTSYATLDVTKPPFDDVKVRQAFAMAVDKETYVKVLMNGAALPAKGLYPPALPGYSLDFKGLEFDPVKARSLLAESKYGGGNLPPITFTVSGYGSDVGSSISGLVQMWEDNLGVKITIQNIEPAHYQDEIASGKHGQLISEGWCADYPDPENFADVLFHSGAEMNRANYSNPELDTLLEKARIEKDVAKRMEMYRQAEQIIVMDAPAVFIDHNMSNTLVRPFIEGYVQSPLGVPLERYLWINSDKLNAGH